MRITPLQERKIQGIKVLYNISYADAAKAIKTNITIGPNTPSEMSPKVQTITNTGNLTTTKKTMINDTDSPTTNPAKISKDATTQTDQVAETQTESPQQHMFNEQYLQELLTGTMQIWDTITNNDERALAVTSLINHVLHSEETTRHKEKQEKHRTSSQSPVDTKKNASGRRSTQTKSKGSSSEKESKTYNLPGYDIYRHDRNITKSKKCGGGCAIFIKRGLGFKYTFSSGSDTPIEYQVGELYDDRKN